MPELSNEQVRSLEALHLIILNAQLRARKQAIIKPEDYERFRDAIKAALPPFDYQAHGFVIEQEL